MLKIPKSLIDELVNHAWTLATQPHFAGVLVYCNSRSDAVIVKEKLDERLDGHDFADASASELLGDERRVRVSVTGVGPSPPMKGTRDR
jgi:hypothetical protein